MKTGDDHPGAWASLRRIVTGENKAARSHIVLEGPPANPASNSKRAGLFEIWTEALSGNLDPKTCVDLAGGALRLSPDIGFVKARWFVVEPLDDHFDAENLKSAARAQFKALGAEHELADQDRHPFMHRTPSLDLVVLIKGSASLVLDEEISQLAPGDVVVQRGTAHAWVAHGGPALFLAVLIGRNAPRQQG